MVSFVIKKTVELSVEEKQQILSLFNDIFQGERSIDEWTNQFVQNPFGYSYHSLMVDHGMIVGHNCGIPSYYIINSKKVPAICNVDSMIAKKYRGIENYNDLLETANERYKEDGFTFLYGFPNEKAYPLVKALGLMNDVGNLYTYCLPYRIGGIKPKLRVFNPLSKFFCYCMLYIGGLLSDSRVRRVSFHKEDSSYNQTRYKRMDADYSKINDKESEFIYKVKDYKGIRTAFLIDLLDKSPQNFCNAVKYILRREKNNFDILLYVGRLPFWCNCMLRIPHKLEPKNFNFMAFMLNEELADKNFFFDLRNWDVNLSNYDLI